MAVSRRTWRSAVRAKTTSSVGTSNSVIQAPGKLTRTTPAIAGRCRAHALFYQIRRVSSTYCAANAHQRQPRKCGKARMRQSHYVTTHLGDAKHNLLLPRRLWSRKPERHRIGVHARQRHAAALSSAADTAEPWKIGEAGIGRQRQHRQHRADRRQIVEDTATGLPRRPTVRVRFDSQVIWPGWAPHAMRARAR